MTGFDRRSFLEHAGVMTAATAAAGSGAEVLTRRLAAVAPGVGSARRAPDRLGYGELAPKEPLNGSDAWLALPRHFTYSVVSRIGDPMTAHPALVRRRGCLRRRIPVRRVHARRRTGRCLLEPRRGVPVLQHLRRGLARLRRHGRHHRAWHKGAR